MLTLQPRRAYDNRRGLYFGARPWHRPGVGMLVPAPGTRVYHSAFQHEPIEESRIDPSIRPVIRDWNRLAFTRTLFSCASHPGGDSPYVSFLLNAADRRALCFLEDLHFVTALFAGLMQVPRDLDLSLRKDAHSCDPRHLWVSLYVGEMTCRNHARFYEAVHRYWWPAVHDLVRAYAKRGPRHGRPFTRRALVRLLKSHIAARSVKPRRDWLPAFRSVAERYLNHLEAPPLVYPWPADRP